MHNCHLEFPQREGDNGPRNDAADPAVEAENAAETLPRPGLRLLSGGLSVPPGTPPAMAEAPATPLSMPLRPAAAGRRPAPPPSPTPTYTDSLPVDELANQCARWLRDCRRRKHTDSSMAMNRFIADKLVWYLRRERWTECSEAALEAFTLYVSEGHREPKGRWDENSARSKQPLSRRSNKTYYEYLHVLCNWLVQKQVLELSPMRRLSPPVYQPDQQLSFTPEELDALLSAAEASRQPHRNIAILLTLLDTGLRESEFCGLRIRDVDLDEGRIAVINGKGEKDREAYIESAAAAAIHHYLEACGRDPERDQYEPLWLGERGGVLGGPLTASGLLALFHRLGKAAGLRTRCHPHKMRRTFATELLDGNTPARYVQRLLGHNSLKMTMHYHYAAQRRVRDDHRANSPSDRLLAGRSRKGRRR